MELLRSAFWKVFGFSSKSSAGEHEISSCPQLAEHHDSREAESPEKTENDEPEARNVEVKAQIRTPVSYLAGSELENIKLEALEQESFLERTEIEMTTEDAEPGTEEEAELGALQQVELETVRGDAEVERQEDVERKLLTQQEIDLGLHRSPINNSPGTGVQILPLPAVVQLPIRNDPVMQKLCKAVIYEGPAAVKQTLDKYYADIVRTQEQQPSCSSSSTPNTCNRQNILATLFGEGLCHETLLHIAAARQDIEMVTILLDAGADIDALDSGGYTPLAAHIFPTGDSNEVNDDMTRLLLERKARPNGTPWLPLHKAAEHGKLSTVKILLEYGADPNAKEPPGDQTPLCMVISASFLMNSDKTEVVKLLLEFGADPAAPSTRRDNAFERGLMSRDIPEENPCQPVFPFGQALMFADPENKLLPLHIVQDLYRCSTCPMLIPFSEYIVDSLVKENDFDHLALFLQTGILFYLCYNRRLLFKTLQPLVERLNQELQNTVDITLYGHLMKCLIDLSPSCSLRLFELLPESAQEEVISLKHLACRRVREMYFVYYDPSVIAKRLVEVLPQRIFHQVMGVWVENPGTPPPSVPSS